MSEMPSEQQSQSMAASNAEGRESEQMDEYYDQEGDEGSAAEDDIFKNNHDLIGVQGILREQKAEINKIKVSVNLCSF